MEGTSSRAIESTLPERNQNTDGRDAKRLLHVQRRWKRGTCPGKPPETVKVPGRAHHQPRNPAFRGASPIWTHTEKKKRRDYKDTNVKHRHLLPTDKSDFFLSPPLLRANAYRPRARLECQLVAATCARNRRSAKSQPPALPSVPCSFTPR